MMIRLTKAQVEYLESADEFTGNKRHETSGVIAKGARVRMANKLADLGLVEYIGHGPFVEAEGDDHWKEWPVYAITDEGRAELKRRASPETGVGGGTK